MPNGQNKNPAGLEARQPVRPSILIGLVVLAVLFVAVLLFSSMSGRAPKPASSSPEQPTAADPQPATAKRPSRAAQPTPLAKQMPSETTDLVGGPKPSPALAAPRPEPTPYARQLMDSL